MPTICVSRTRSPSVNRPAVRPPTARASSWARISLARLSWMIVRVSLAIVSSSSVAIES